MYKRQNKTKQNKTTLKEEARRKTTSDIKPSVKDELCYRSIWLCSEVLSATRSRSYNIGLIVLYKDEEKTNRHRELLDCFMYMHLETITVRPRRVHCLYLDGSSSIVELEIFVEHQFFSFSDERTIRSRTFLFEFIDDDFVLELFWHIWHRRMEIRRCSRVTSQHGANGVRRMMKDDVPWKTERERVELPIIHCLSHRLEKKLFYSCCCSQRIWRASSCLSR